MSTFVLLTITGLGLGAMYFLVASGLSLIYGLGAHMLPRFTGNPIRKTFFEPGNKEEALKFFGFDPNKKTIFISIHTAFDLVA